MLNFKNIVDKAWENKEILPQDAELQQALQKIFEALDCGEIRVAEKQAGHWKTYEWIKKAILLFFRLQPTEWMEGFPQPSYDKIPLKCTTWREKQFQEAGFRLAPGAIIRLGAYIAPNAVIMPSFINVGAYIGKGTMVDTAVRVGSCAQIGDNCHLSDSVGIGGVLEPVQANPVIIEDNCFIGARCQIVEGVIVEEGSVLGMGTTLGASTKIVSRQTGEITTGRIPAYSVVVPGSLGISCNKIQEGATLSIDCAVIVKTVDAQTRQKTEINALLRY